MVIPPRNEPPELLVADRIDRPQLRTRGGVYHVKEVFTDDKMTMLADATSPTVVRPHDDEEDADDDVLYGDKDSAMVSSTDDIIGSTQTFVQVPAEPSAPPPPVHKCVDCDKTFNKACYLTQHNKSFHAGDKPFKCSRYTT